MPLLAAERWLPPLPPLRAAVPPLLALSCFSLWEASSGSSGSVDRRMEAAPALLLCALRRASWLLAGDGVDTPGAAAGTPCPVPGAVSA